jgi:hypothetical protein
LGRAARDSTGGSTGGTGIDFGRAIVSVGGCRDGLVKVGGSCLGCSFLAGSCLEGLGIGGASLGLDRDFGCGSSTGIDRFGLASFKGAVFSRGAGRTGGRVGCCGSDSVRSTTSDCTFLLWTEVVPVETFGRLGARSEGSGRLGVGG